MSTTADTPTGLAANKAIVERFFAAFNDQTPDVFDEEGAAFGRALTATGISIYVLANGRITETRHEVNVSEQPGG